MLSCMQYFTSFFFLLRQFTVLWEVKWKKWNVDVLWAFTIFYIQVVSVFLGILLVI